MLVLGIVLAAAPAPAVRRVTTVALVRHGEKKGELTDPGLTAAGWERAQRLARVFKGAKVDALIASDLKRTQETLQPLADDKGLRLKALKAPADVARAVKALPEGSFAIVAHHSFTMREILQGLGVGAREIDALDLEAYENLLLVTYHPDLETQLLVLKY